MGTIFREAAAPDYFFLIIAVTGTCLFFLRLVLLFLGMNAGSGEIMDSDLTDTDTAFGFISINTLTAFFMMFGWMSLACRGMFAMGPFLSATVGLAAGISAMFLIVYLFKISKMLVSRGSVFDVKDTLGKTATVYSTIRPGDKGRIQVSIDGGMTREIDAVSEDAGEISSFSAVEIVRIVDEHTVSVKRKI